MGSGSAGFRFSQRAARGREQPISYLMAQAVGNPDLISLAAGLVDYETLPAAEARELLDRLLGERGAARRALQYGTTEGLAELRRRLLEHIAALDNLRPEDLDASADDVLITNGSQQLLYILTDLLVDPGDIVVTAWPSYFVYTGALQSFGARVRAVDMDAGGLVPESLERVLGDLGRAGELGRVKIVYICDYYQNPTGLTLAAERRAEVLRIVERYSSERRILILEDAAYRELSYGPAGGAGDSPGDVAAPALSAAPVAPPSIKSHDRDNRFVALAQTFSKPFSPGLKIGYGLLPRDLVGPATIQKGCHDFGSANLNQHLLLAAMESGVYERHVGLLRERYARKRNAMLAALEEHLGDFEPGATAWTRPAGGLYIWLTLPERFDTGRGGSLFSRAVAEGVLYVPGAYCHPDDAARTPPRNTIRLSFGVPTVGEIHEGIGRLARAIRG